MEKSQPVRHVLKGAEHHVRAAQGIGGETKQHYSGLDDSAQEEAQVAEAKRKVAEAQELVSVKKALAAEAEAKLNLARTSGVTGKTISDIMLGLAEQVADVKRQEAVLNDEMAALSVKERKARDRTNKMQAGIVRHRRRKESRNAADPLAADPAEKFKDVYFDSVPDERPRHVYFFHLEKLDPAVAARVVVKKPADLSAMDQNFHGLFILAKDARAWCPPLSCNNGCHDVGIDDIPEGVAHYLSTRVKPVDVDALDVVARMAFGVVVVGKDGRTWYLPDLVPRGADRKLRHVIAPDALRAQGLAEFIKNHFPAIDGSSEPHDSGGVAVTVADGERARYVPDVMPPDKVAKGRYYVRYVFMETPTPEQEASFGHYDAIDRAIIGKGGQAVIIRAVDSQTNADVVLKILRPTMSVDGKHVLIDELIQKKCQLLSTSGLPPSSKLKAQNEMEKLIASRSDHINRLVNESRRLTQVGLHSNVLPLYGKEIFFYDDRSSHLDQHFLVFPFMREGDLFNYLWIRYRPETFPDKERLGRYPNAGEPLDSYEFLGYATGCARGLAAIHAVNRVNPIVHGDIKTKNVFLGDDRKQVWVGDLGNARNSAVEAENFLYSNENFPPEVREAWLPIIRKHNAQNTKWTMSDLPEVEPKLSHDVWGLGGVLYEIATGQSPYLESILMMPTDCVLQKPTPPSQLNSKIKPEIDAVVMRCLEFDPRRRFQNALEVIDALSLARQEIENKSGIRKASIADRASVSVQLPQKGRVAHLKDAFSSIVRAVTGD